MSLDPYLTLYTKTDLKWIIDLNAKAKIMKLQRKMEHLHDLGVGKFQVCMAYSSRWSMLARKAIITKESNKLD